MTRLYPAPHLSAIAAAQAAPGQQGQLVAALAAPGLMQVIARGEPAAAFRA